MWERLRQEALSFAKRATEVENRGIDQKIYQNDTMNTNKVGII